MTSMTHSTRAPDAKRVTRKYTQINRLPTGPSSDFRIELVAFAYALSYVLNQCQLVERSASRRSRPLVQERDLRESLR